VQKVTAGASGLSLPDELAAARQLLASTGIAVEVDGFPVPDEVGAVLATVVREAVTNVLRHARATRCEIRLVQDAEAIRLTVTNDGVEDPSPGRTQSGGGRGLPSLTARVAAIGGRLDARQAEDRFEVTVRIPSEPAAAVGDADGVHPVPGTELRHG
jgi:two-component system sensor histidine kinase DesK